MGRDIAKAVKSGKLTTGEISTICEVTPQTVINWTERDKALVCQRFLRGPRKYKVKAVVDFLTENGYPVPPELVTE